MIMSPLLSLAYGTNIWSHHQKPVTTVLSKLLGCEYFKMALFEDVSAERRQMGWGEHQSVSWVVGPPRNEQEKYQIIKQCVEADVMVFGSCPMEVLKARVAANKLTLVASERILKKRYHSLRMLNPRYKRGMMQYRELVNHSSVHALAIGSYAANDLRTLGVFGDRIWKWGYFIDVCPDPPVPVSVRPLRILWVGRMLKWKNVDVLLRAVAMIQNLPHFGECVIVGDGEEQNYLQGLAKRLSIKSECVRFHPPVSFEVVRQMMRDADVYVLPSDRGEGWGAVAGEAMSEGCVLVANEEAGAARDLVVDGETGFLYQNGNVKQLALLLEKLAGDYSLRMEMRQKAWERMHFCWHPNVAAERLIALSEGLLGMKDMPNLGEGPCCKA